MSSSPSSVSGAAPDESTRNSFAALSDTDLLIAFGSNRLDQGVLFGKHGVLSTSLTAESECLMAEVRRRMSPAASREEPSDRPNEQALAFFDKLASESWMIASAWRVVRDALAASSSPSAASPEPLSPPIPSREDARDAARWRFLRDGWPDVSLGWLDVETGNFGGEHGDEPLYARTPSVGDDVNERSWEGDTPDEAVDAAMSAVSHPEAQTNG